MSDDLILEENDNFRVKLEYDMYPEQPYSEGGWPILRIEYGLYGWRAEHLVSGGVSDENVQDAVSRWGSPSKDEWKYMEKYLRGFLGATNVETYYSGDYWYVAYDPAEWRARAGLMDGDVPEDMLSEWKAWIEGEVYTIVVEQKTHVYQDQRRHKLGSFDAVSAEFDEWEEVSAVGGYYGYEYAVENAREQFADANGNVSWASYAQTLKTLKNEGKV